VLIPALIGYAGIRILVRIMGLLPVALPPRQYFVNGIRDLWTIQRR
jgi:small neutral amino acid transporter SnatA (MarC family)